MSAQPKLSMQPHHLRQPDGHRRLRVRRIRRAGRARRTSCTTTSASSASCRCARHKTRAITTYRQGDCTFLINEDPDSFAADFAAAHGPSACGFAIRVNKLAEWARVQALKNGAESDQPTRN